MIASRLRPGPVGAVFGLVGVLLALWSGIAVAAPPATIALTGVVVNQGEVRFLVVPSASAPTVDPSTLRVSVDKQRLDITAEPSTATTIAPSRGLMVVLDGSGHVTDSALAAAKAAAAKVATALPPDVWLGLAAARARPDVVLAPTQDRQAFAQALTNLVADGAGPAMLDTIAATPPAFDASGLKGGSELRVLVITDGHNTGSTRTAASTVTAVNAGGRGIVVDAIGLDLASDLDEPGLHDVTTIVTASGGRAVVATTAAAAADAAGMTIFASAIAVRAFVPPGLAGKSVRLDVSVAGTELAATAEVLVPVGASLGASAGVSFSWVPAWAVWVVGIVIFLGIIGAVLAALWPRSAKHSRMKEIDNFGPGRATATTRATGEESPGGVIARTALAATASVVRSGQMETRITQRLERAGMRLRAAEWVLLRLCLAVAAGALFFAVAGLAGGVMGLITGWLLTLLYQTVRIDRRTAAFAEQLPDALQLMIGSLRSGFSLSQALDSLVREAPEPVAAEFGRALSEHRLGVDVSEALERVAQRTQSEDLGWAVMAVRIQREVGGNLAEVLQTTVDTMRERARLRRHVLSLSAEGRISAWVLIGLPLVLALFMFLYRRDYMVPLLTDPIGITMLIGGGMLFVIGIFWMTRVVKVDA